MEQIPTSVFLKAAEALFAAVKATARMRAESKEMASLIEHSIRSALCPSRPNAPAVAEAAAGLVEQVKPVELPGREESKRQRAKKLLLKPVRFVTRSRVPKPYLYSLDGPEVEEVVRTWLKKVLTTSRGRDFLALVRCDGETPTARQVLDRYHPAFVAALLRPEMSSFREELFKERVKRAEWRQRVSRARASVEAAGFAVASGVSVYVGADLLFLDSKAALALGVAAAVTTGATAATAKIRAAKRDVARVSILRLVARIVAAESDNQAPSHDPERLSSTIRVLSDDTSASAEEAQPRVLIRPPDPATIAALREKVRTLEEDATNDGNPQLYQATAMLVDSLESWRLHPDDPGARKDVFADLTAVVVAATPTEEPDS